MGNPLRNKDPEIYRLITTRTEGGHLWIRPSKRVNQIVGGVLARYAEICQVEVFAYTVLSNHYHLIIRAPRENTDEFEENVNKELARRLNWKNRRQGKFWSRRYDDKEILSKDDLMEAFLYVTSNAVRHGLVEHPSLWPGINSYNQCLSEKSLRYPFHHYSAEEDEEKVTYHNLKLTPLPQFADLPRSERSAKIASLLEERANKLVSDRRESGLGFLGVEAIKAQDPYNKPINMSKSPRPPCYTKDAALRRTYRRQEHMRRERYNDASMRFRLGELTVRFPAFTYKPPLHRRPRRRPFELITEDYFKNVA